MVSLHLRVSGFLSLLSFVVRPSSPRILLVCYAAFLPFVNICVYLKKIYIYISICVLHSDNAKEYFSAPFTSFMSQHGILHQSSCAHTPQQNGVAECKNRHLVETARTLLLYSDVPFRFWGDAVLTACYLINRMPSSVLHDQIPHSLLFPD